MIDPVILALVDDRAPVPVTLNNPPADKSTGVTIPPLLNDNVTPDKVTVVEPLKTIVVIPAVVETEAT